MLSIFFKEEQDKHHKYGSIKKSLEVEQSAKRKQELSAASDLFLSSLTAMDRAEFFEQ